MKKNFTKEDIMKKHETNIKSATTVILLSGVLGLIYVVRYFFKGNFDFYFSLSFTDIILKIGHDKGNVIVPSVISVVYILAYLALAIFAGKKPKLLTTALVIYVFDFLCLILSMAFVFPQDVDSASFIDVIMHLFILVFLIVGIVSATKNVKK